jgi:hypothetical protein
MANSVLNGHRLSGVVNPLVTGRESMISQQTPDSTKDEDRDPNMDPYLDIFHVNSLWYFGCPAGELPEEFSGRAGRRPDMASLPGPGANIDAYPHWPIAHAYSDPYAPYAAG